MRGIEVFAAAALIVLLALAAHVYVTTPVVIFGHPSGRCLWVEGAGSCDQVPRRHRPLTYSDRWGGDDAR